MYEGNVSAGQASWPLCTQWRLNAIAATPVTAGAVYAGTMGSATMKNSEDNGVEGILRYEFVSRTLQPKKEHFGFYFLTAGNSNDVAIHTHYLWDAKHSLKTYLTGARVSADHGSPAGNEHNSNGNLLTSGRIVGLENGTDHCAAAVVLTWLRNH